MRPELPKIVFVFPGIGSQWFGMGRQLLAREAVFHRTLVQCEQAMQPFVTWSLLDQLLADKASPTYRLDDLDVLWPTLISIEIALAALWRSWEVEPDAVIGHSIGEVAASHVTGVFGLEDTMRIICNQGRFMEQARGGAMAVVGLSPAEAQEAMADYEEQLVISNINSPYSVVLSGDPIALNKVIEPLEAQEIFCKHIPINAAAHSPHMDPFQADLLAALVGLSRPGVATVPFYSTTLGAVSDGTNQDAGYWVQNFRQPVLFADMVQRLLADGYHRFLEISPHPILLHAIRQGFQHVGQYGIALPSLRRDEPEELSLLNSRRELYMEEYSGEPDSVTSPTVYETRAKDGEQGDIRKALLAVEPGQQRQALFEAHVRKQLTQVLQLPPSRIPLSGQFKALGLDSLSSVEFAKRLETTLGLSLSSTLVWNYPTIAELMPYLANRMGISLNARDERKTIPAVPLHPPTDENELIAGAGKPGPELADLSLDQVEALLDEELSIIDNLLKGA